MPKPPTPNTDSSRYSLSIVPIGRAFGYWFGVLSRVEPLTGRGVNRTIPITRSRGKGPPGDERLVSPVPALPAQLRAPLRRPPRRGDARGRARALFPPAADHRVRAGGVRLRPPHIGHGAGPAHRRGAHLRGARPRARALRPRPPHGPEMDAPRLVARGHRHRAMR